MKLEEPKAILIGLTLIALAIVIVGFLGPRERYQLLKWGDGPRFVRLNTVTGEGTVCSATFNTGELDCQR